MKKQLKQWKYSPKSMKKTDFKKNNNWKELFSFPEQFIM